MKKFSQITKPSLLFTVIAVVVMACGKKETSVSDLIAEGNIEKLRSKRDELLSQQKQIEKQVAELDQIIDEKSEQGNLPLVTTFRAQSEEFYHYVELQGDVTTKQNVLIYPEVSGTLMKVYVEEGQQVKEGQLLGTIDDGGMKNQLLQMKSQLALAKTTFERQKNLWEQNIGSEIQYLQSKTSYEAQKSSVDQMQDQLEKFEVRAPFSGVIDDIIKDQGTVVSPGPGSEIFRIINLSNMYIEVMVPESYITSIVPGKRVQVYFPILGEAIQSKVRETGNFINPDNRSFNARIPVPNKSGNVKPNLTAKVKINDYYKERAILIPQSVVSENAAGQQYVYVVADVNEDGTATAKRKIIETGKTQDGNVEIISGIADDDQLIKEGARSVKDGQTVKILKG